MLTATVGCIVGTATSPLPAAAAPTALDLAMVPGSGELLIRDAEEAYPLESPTSVTGTIDAGVIGGTTLTTPEISFAQEVLGGLATAYVDASFTQVSPGSGVLSTDGDLSLTVTLRADLHIEVPAAALVADCTSTPITLELISTEPYSEETGVVRVVDEDFTIPAINETAACSDTAVGPLNEQLAGGGHSLGLTLEGAMDIPTCVDCVASTTTLAVAPSGTSSLGQEVTMTATVASGDAGSSVVPTGLVTFLDGNRTVGQSALVGGVATLATSALRLGDHQLSARYSGDVVYGSSTSSSVAHTVDADPVVEAEIPSFLTIGAAPAEFDVAVDNPSAGRAVANARIDVAIKRYSVTGSNLARLTSDDVLLEVQGPGGGWAPVPLTTLPVDGPGSSPVAGVVGTLGPELGRPLAAGAVLTDRVRLSFPAGDPLAGPGPLDVVFDVVEVAPDTGEVVRALSSTAGRMNLFHPGRLPTVVGIDRDWFAFRPDPVRQQGTIGALVSVTSPLGSSVFPTGTIAVAIDGQRVPFWATYPGDLSQPNAMTAPIPEHEGNNNVQIPVPSWVGIGSHKLTFSYSGDAQYAPSSLTVDITVIESAGGVIYQCEKTEAYTNRRYNIEVLSTGKLPAAARAGTTVDIEDFTLDIVGSMEGLGYDPFKFASRDDGATTTIDIGPDGSGTGPDLTVTPSEMDLFEMTTDFDVAFTGEEATVTLNGDPGQTIVPTIEGIVVDFVGQNGGPTQTITCEPLGEPVSFSPVTLAGTTLAVDAPSPARADDDVTLTASTYPSTATGTVRFYDGGDLIDIAPVANGKAVSTVQLPAGQHSLTARFLAGASAPSTTSEAVALAVGPAIECGDVAEAGNGAAVRLVYLELLRRCPEPAGYEYWTDALDDGDVTREGFARQISISMEARKVIVDDAYEMMLERRAEPAARTFWAGRLATGRFDALLADLAASPEFRTKAGGTNEGFVDRVYERIIGRPADADGRWYWMIQLSSGVPRRQLVLTLANLSEPLGAVVTSAYAEILGRAPSASERTDGVTLLRRSSNRSHLYARLIGHGDFFARAQRFPNPED
ncbi:MAG TPA: Ig-like domain repeat protein [Iamia sp.]|nr:Ig-like domain repeat protein [Iamia sp.]